LRGESRIKPPTSAGKSVGFMTTLRKLIVARLPAAALQEKIYQAVGCDHGPEASAAAE
jgi:hypothetical protein